MILGLCAIGTAFSLFYFGGENPLAPFAHAVPENCQLAELVRFDLLRRVEGIETEITRVEQEYLKSWKNLGIDSKLKLQAIFHAGNISGSRLQVFTFETKLTQFHPHSSFFDVMQVDDAVIAVDKFMPETAWAIDGAGQLLSGTQRSVADAVIQFRLGAKTKAFSRLSRMVGYMPSSSLRLAVVDFQSMGGKAETLFPKASKQLEGCRIDGLGFWLAEEGLHEPWIGVEGYFPTRSDAKVFHSLCRGLRCPLTDEDACCLTSFNPTWPLKLIRDSRLTRNGTTVSSEVTYPIPQLRLGLEAEATRLADVRLRLSENIQAFVTRSLVDAENKIQREEYSAALELLESVRAVEPSAAPLASLMQKARDSKRMLEQSQIDLALFEKALGQGDLNAAANHIKSALSIRPMDRTLLWHQSRLEAALTSRETERLWKDASKSIASSDFEKAAISLSEIRRLQPADTRATENLTLLKSVRDANQLVNKGKERVIGVGKCPVESDIEELRQLHDRFWLPLMAENSLFRAIAPKLKKDSSELVLAIMEYFRRAVRECRSSADEALRTGEFEFAIEKAKEGVAILGQSNEMVKRAGSLCTKEAVVVSTDLDKEIQSERTALENVQKAATGKRKIQVAIERSNLAQKQAIEGKSRSLALLDAIGNLDAAAKLFDEAKPYLDPLQVELVKRVERERRALVRVAAPLDVDFASKSLPTDWVIPKENWGFKLSTTGEFWLRPMDVDIATLRSTVEEWPVEYTCEVVLAMLTPKGDISNSSLASYEAAIALQLVAKDGKIEPLSILIGRDSKIRLQDRAQLSIGRQSYSIENIVLANRPLELRIQKSLVGFTVGLNGKEIAQFRDSRRFSQLQLTVKSHRNARGDFVVHPSLRRIRLAIPGRF